MMRKKRIKNILIWLMPLFFVIGVESQGMSSDALGFTYENELPKNQIGKHTYFELMVKPGDKQTLVTNVTNNTDEDMTVMISINDATTSRMGEIDYSSSKEKLVGEKTLSLKEMIEAPTQVKLKPKETKKIELKLKVPEQEFDGLVLGSVQLKQANQEEKKQEKERVSLDNEYSYIYSISLKENDNKVKTDVQSAGARYDDMAYITIENKQQKIVSNMNIENIVMTKESDKVLDDFRVENYRMAPNSRLELPVEGTEELAPGSYRTLTKVTVNEEQWQFESEFEVTKNNQKKIDSNFDETTKEKTVNWLVIMLILLSFIGVTALIFYVLNKKKKSK